MYLIHFLIYINIFFIDIPFDDKLARDDSGKFGFYKPIVYPNDFWLLRQNAYPINETLR